MKMIFKSTRSVSSIILLFLLAPVWSQADEAKKIELAVQYVGVPSSERGRSFLDFLEQNFSSAEAISSKDIDSPQAAAERFDNADVLIIDANLAGRLPVAYSKPMVVLSGSGVQTAASLGAKLDWLCLCLRADAHGVRFDHPIFQGPREVDRTTVEKVDEYTGKTIKAWRVHRDLDEPGLVATRRRFVESPDSEIISGGTNMKGDRGVPLVREGNLFLWGFAGSPAEMTAAARSALVNVIAYMKQFDGFAPTRRIGMRERARWKPILDSPYVKPASLRTYFGPTLYDSHGTDKESYRADLGQREDYLYVPRGSARLSIDPDAEAMGHATNSLDLIRAALNTDDERGRRVLERYWPEDDLVVARPKNIAELDEVASQVVFSESHGYRWLSRPPTAAPRDWEVVDAVEAMELPEPSEIAPAIFGVRLVGGYNNKSIAYDQKLGLVKLVVYAQMLDDWHVTVDNGGTNAAEVDIDVQLPEGLQWHSPEFELKGETKKNGKLVEGQGPLRWTRDIWVRGESGTFDVSGTVTFVVCSESVCQPPVKFPFKTSVKVR